MKWSTTGIALVILASLLGGTQVQADSIWARRSPRRANLFVDEGARRVGDLLTVLIRETTDIQNKDQRSMDKETATGGTFKLSGNTSSNGAGRSAEADFDSNGTSTRKFDGKSQFSSDRQIVDRITVTVKDVLPNGNMLIAGYRSRGVADEFRSMYLSGIVRPSDVGLSNMIESQFIADFQIKYEGTGDESRFTKQGWWGRTMNRLWPF